MKNLIVLFAVLTASQAWAQQLYFPNLGKNATGTTSTTHNSLDVNIVGGSFSLTEEATAADGGALPALTKVISGYDGSNVQVIKTDAGGAVQVDVESSALPAGAATSAKQDSLAALFPTSLGQKTMANSLACTLASDQSALAVTGTFWQATQPVSAASLPLPTGAATSAKQPALGTAGTASADVITVQGIASMTALKVDGSAVTQPISAASLPLPSGAATSANQTTANTSLSSIDGKLASLGQKAMTGSAPVVIASDQSAIPASQSGTWNVRHQDGSGNAITSSTVGSNRGIHTQPLGKTAVDKARNDYTGTSVTTGAYVTLKASLAGEAQEVEIFDSSGQTLVLATGAAASEVDQVYILPGGNGRIPLRIASGTRVSVKAVSATASVGELTVNFYGL